MNSSQTSRRTRGFTLIELVVVIILLGILSAVAVAKFINLATAARVAAVNTMAGALRQTSENVHVLCKLDPACDYDHPNQLVTVSGRPVYLNYGWLDAGDTLNAGQIDDWVTYTGFTATIPTSNRTVFTLDDAPNPATCMAVYLDVTWNWSQTRTILTDTSGC